MTINLKNKIYRDVLKKIIAENQNLINPFQFLITHIKVKKSS